MNFSPPTTQQMTIAFCSPNSGPVSQMSTEYVAHYRTQFDAKLLQDGESIPSAKLIQLSFRACSIDSEHKQYKSFIHRSQHAAKDLPEYWRLPPRDRLIYHLEEAQPCQSQLVAHDVFLVASPHTELAC